MSPPGHLCPSPWCRWCHPPGYFFHWLCHRRTIVYVRAKLIPLSTRTPPPLVSGRLLVLEQGLTFVALPPNLPFYRRGRHVPTCLLTVRSGLQHRLRLRRRPR